MIKASLLEWIQELAQAPAQLLLLFSLRPLSVAEFLHFCYKVEEESNKHPRAPSPWIKWRQIHLLLVGCVHILQGLLQKKNMGNGGSKRVFLEVTPYVYILSGQMARRLSNVAGNQNHLTGVAVRVCFAESWPQLPLGEWDSPKDILRLCLWMSMCLYLAKRKTCKIKC